MKKERKKNYTILIRSCKLLPKCDPLDLSQVNFPLSDYMF